MSKQPLILAIAGLLETSPSHTEDIAIYGQRITSILSHYDFTFATSLAAAEALADALSIEEEEQSPPAIMNLTEGSLLPFPAPHRERAPEHDLPFARGDDYAADGWRHLPTGHITRSVVGSGASTATSELNVPEVLFLLPSPRINILRDTPLMQLTRQSDLSGIPYQGEEEETL